MGEIWFKKVHPNFVINMINAKYLVVGSSAAGISAVNTLAKLDPEGSIWCVTSQAEKPYNKCFLVDLITGQRQMSQIYLPVNLQVNFLYQTKVLSIDNLNQVANLSNGQKISYQKLFLAIGVSPFVPPIKGLANNVFKFHDLLDTQSIDQFIKQNEPKRAVIIGAGLTGVECADALWKKGLHVSIIEQSGNILGKLLDANGADFLQNIIRKCGVEIYLNQTLSQITSNQIYLQSGPILPADLIVLATGVRPNGVEMIGQQLDLINGYVLVNQYLQTNIANIWAAGDMAMLPDLLTSSPVASCSWPDAMLQGNLAAQNMVGANKALAGLLPVANSHFFGKDFISFGILPQATCQHQTDDNYQLINLDQAGLVQGALLIGDISLYPNLKRCLLTKQPYEDLAKL